MSLKLSCTNVSKTSDFHRHIKNYDKVLQLLVQQYIEEYFVLKFLTRYRTLALSRSFLVRLQLS